MKFRILGPVEVEARDGLVDLGGPKQRAVLAALLIDVGQVVSLDRLVDLLWGSRPPNRAVGTLQAYVSNLRRTLEPERTAGTRAQILVRRPPGYVLSVPRRDVDAVVFEESFVTGTRLLAAGRPAAARDALERGLALWRGPALSDLANEAFAQDEADRLELLRSAAVESQIDADLELGRHAAVVPELERLVVRYPLRERLWEQLMVALYRGGRQSEALRAYQRARAELARELGIEPGPALQRLERNILDQLPALEWRPSAPDMAGAAVRRRRADDPDQQGDDIQTPPRLPLVGRERPLAALTGALAAARMDGARLALVAGEAGIGKSHLVEELAVHARRASFDVAWAHGSEGLGAPAFWPWVQVIRDALASRTDEEIADVLGPARGDLAQIVPELRQDPPSPNAPVTEDPDAARFQLYDSVTRFLVRASTHRPLLIVLDDLQWADVSSLRLLQFLVTEGRRGRLVVVGTYRDDEVIAGHPLHDVMSALAAEPSTERIALGRLDQQDVDRYLHLVDADVGETVAAAVHRRSEGNPLFMVELVRLLASEGRLDDDATVRVSRELPGEIRDVIQRRIAHLPEDAQAALTVAAVIGNDFRVDVMERACLVDLDELLDLVEMSLLTRVIIDLPDRPGHYRFAHGLIRETLYDGLTAVRRARLHARVGRALEDVWGPDLEPHLAELAYHHGEGAPAGTAANALDYAVRAARQAASGLAYEQSADHWAQALRALELANPGDRETRYEIMMGLSQARRCSGDIAGSRDALQSAIEIVARMGDAERLARAAVSFGGGTVWSWRSYGVVDQQAISLLEGALVALGEEDSALRSEVLGTLAVELYYADQRSRSSAMSREAVEMARRLGDPRVLASALNMHYIANLGPDHPDERLAIADEMVALPASGAPPEIGLVGRLYRMVSLLELGDIDRADHDLDPARELADELRQPALIAQIAWYRAMRSLLEGRFDEAEALSLEALALHHRTSLWGETECYGTQLFTMRRDQGRAAELEPLLTALLEGSEIEGFREGVALIYATVGRPDDARRVLAEGSEPFPPLPRDWSWLFRTCLQAEVCAELGEDTDAAARLYQDLLPYAELVAVIGTGVCCWGPVAYFLGRLSVLLQDGAASAGHYEAALTLADRLGARPWATRTRLRYAELLLGCNDRGGANRARRLLSEAAVTAREIGMSGLTGDVAAVAALLPETPAIDS